MKYLQELMQLLEGKKIADDRYYIVTGDSRPDLYIERGFKSEEAAERYLSQEREDADHDDEIHDCEVVRGGALKKQFPKLFEAGRTFTIKNGSIKPRGAPEVKARAFDKVHPRTGARPDRSTLGSSVKGPGKYVALEFADEGDFISVIVVRDDIEMTYHEPKKDPNDEYNGINVLFFPDGKIDGDTYDVQSKRQWLKDKEKIVAVAKAALKDENLSGQYDGLGGVSVKRGKGELSFNTDNHVIRKKPLDRHHSDK